VSLLRDASVRWALVAKWVKGGQFGEAEDELAGSLQGTVSTLSTSSASSRSGDTSSCSGEEAETGSPHRLTQRRESLASIDAGERCGIDKRLRPAEVRSRLEEIGERGGVRYTCQLREVVVDDGEDLFEDGEMNGTSSGKLETRCRSLLALHMGST